MATVYVITVIRIKFISIKNLLVKLRTSVFSSINWQCNFERQNPFSVSFTMVGDYKCVIE